MNICNTAVSNSGGTQLHMSNPMKAARVFWSRKCQAFIPTGVYPVAIRTLSLPGDSAPAPAFPEPVLLTPWVTREGAPYAAAGRGDIGESSVGGPAAENMGELETCFGRRLLSPEI